VDHDSGNFTQFSAAQQQPETYLGQICHPKFESPMRRLFPIRLRILVTLLPLNKKRLR